MHFTKIRMRFDVKVKSYPCFFVQPEDVFDCGYSVWCYKVLCGILDTAGV